jgi:hypothetical protein
MEETSILQYASMTADGSVPTKDFWTEYGPMNVYAPAAVFSVTGPSLLAERLLGLLYRGILLASLFVILRRYSQLAALIGVTLAWWMLAPWGAMAYAWIAGMGLAVASLALISGGTHPPSSRRLFVAATTAGLALSRPHRGPWCRSGHHCVATSTPMETTRRWWSTWSFAIPLAPWNRRTWQRHAEPGD